MSNLKPKEDGLEFVSLVRRGVEERVKNKIANDIIESYVTDLKEKLKKELTTILRQVSFESITSMTDVLSLRDGVRVLIKVNDDVFDSDKAGK